MKDTNRVVWFVIIVALCFGCSGGGISERKLVKIIAEMHLADALYEPASVVIPALQKDSTAIYAPIFAKYGVSRSQFYESLMPYTTNKEKMAALYEKIVQHLEKNEQRTAKTLEKAKETSADVLKLDSAENIEH
jgi:hypothetical protein